MIEQESRLHLDKCRLEGCLPEHILRPNMDETMNPHLHKHTLVLHPLHHMLWGRLLSNQYIQGPSSSQGSQQMALSLENILFYFFNILLADIGFNQGTIMIWQNSFCFEHVLGSVLSISRCLCVCLTKIEIRFNLHHLIREHQKWRLREVTAS